MKKINNAVIVDTCTKRVTALKANVSNKAVISINGKAHKVSAVLAIYQNCLDIRASLSTKRADVAATLVASANAEALRRAADRALKPWVVNEFGAESQQAHDFGFPPAKAPTRSVENKAEAKALAEATRKARHTMGSRQKEKVRGTIGVPTEPAAPAINPVQPTAPPVVSTPAPVAPAATAPVQNTVQNGVLALNGALNGAAPHA